MSSSSEQEKNNDGGDNNNNNNNNGSLKKGTWSKDEDKILVDYVTKYGVGNWNAIQKRTELARCGRSCRLRWLNHLKPGVKKGKFSEQEEKAVSRMEELGFKWCKMAEQLPGRSDNDIKNFCNVRKRKQNKNPKLSGSSSLSHDHELNDKRENSLTGSTSQQLDSQEDKYSKQLPNLFDVSNKQLPKFPKLGDDSNMFYTSLGSTSTSNHTTPSWINRAGIGTSFMHKAMVPISKNMDYSLIPSLEHNLQRKYPSKYVEINANNSKQRPKLFDVSNKVPKWIGDSNMLYKYNNLGSTSSINRHTTPTFINRVPNQNMYYSRPSLEHSLYGKYPSISDEINKNNSEQLPKSFQVPNKELPKLVDDSNMLYKNVGSTYVGSASTSNHTTPTWINRGGNGTSYMQYTMVPNPLPPCSYLQNMDYQLGSYKKLGEYPQNPLPPPKEAQYQRTGSVSPYRTSSRESIFLTHIKKIMEDSHASRVRSSKVNLVDENWKKPISFENDFGANSHSNFTDSCFRHDSSLLDNNNNLNDKLPHDVKDTLDASINENGIDWGILSNFGSLDNNDNNNLHDKLPHIVKYSFDAAINGKDIVSDHLPNFSSSNNDDNNNLHDKIPHDIKDTLDAVVYGKSFHPK